MARPGRQVAVCRHGRWKRATRSARTRACALRWWVNVGAARRRATAPRVADVDALAAFLLGAAPRPGTHTTRVFLFDRQARLAFRTTDLPTTDHVVDLLEQLARSGT